MKESIGESSMTIVTIIIVAGALGGILTIIMSLIGGQKMRANCENAGGEVNNGECFYNDKKCSKDADGNYFCG